MSPTNARLRRWEEFYDAAIAYNRAKLKHLDLKRRIRALQFHCININPSEILPGAWEGVPCWQERDGRGEETQWDERCDACQDSYALVEQRREVGATISGLAARMYATFRKVDGDG
jgi:hypothetical protein